MLADIIGAKGETMFVFGISITLLSVALFLLITRMIPTPKLPISFTEVEKYLAIKRANADLWSNMDFSKTKFIIYEGKIEEAYVLKSNQPRVLVCFINEGEFRNAFSRDIFETKEEAELELNRRKSILQPTVEKKIIDWRGGYKIVDLTTAPN